MTVLNSIIRKKFPDTAKRESIGYILLELNLKEEEETCGREANISTSLQRQIGNALWTDDGNKVMQKIICRSGIEYVQTLRRIQHMYVCMEIKTFQS